LPKTVKGKIFGLASSWNKRLAGAWDMSGTHKNKKLNEKPKSTIHFAFDKDGVVVTVLQATSLPAIH